MALVDLQREVVELCFGPEPDAARCARIGDERIWRIYRESIRNRLRSELKVALPRTFAAAGAAFEPAFAQFLAAAPPRTRYFHAVVGCFAESAMPFFARQPGVPPHVADLCAYEAALWTVGDLPDPVPQQLAEFAFDRTPVLAPALRLLALGHAVHVDGGSAPALRGGASDTGADGGAYAPGEVHLCVHRRPDEKKARTWSMNAVTYDLMQSFTRGGATVAEALQRVAERRAIALDEKFIDGLCTVLADFIDRGIILGVR